MNRWKVAFWIYLTLSVVVTGGLLYAIMDQSVTLSYHNVGYDATERDLETMIELFNHAGKSKAGVETVLKGHPFYEYMDFSSDTIPLSKISLVFEDDTLKGVVKQW